MKEDALRSKLHQAIPKAKSKKPVVANEPEGAIKVSVSLYKKDLAKLEEIKAFMRTQGYRTLNDSQAIQLAVRCVNISPIFVDKLVELQQGDRRGRRE